MTAKIDPLPQSNPFCLVLNQPQNPLNVGAVCRAMMNLGFDQLSIVDPEVLDENEIARTARKALPLYRQAERYQTLREAIKHCDFVAGFSPKISKNLPPTISFESWLEEWEALRPKSTALLFGPESHGLGFEELAACNYVVRIDSNQEYDSFNLAQAVTIVLYSLRQRINRQDRPEVSSIRAARAHYEPVMKLLGSVSEVTQFKTAGTPQRLMPLLKNMLLRTDFKPRELRILAGFLSRIHKTLRPD